MTFLTTKLASLEPISKEDIEALRWFQKNYGSPVTSNSFKIAYRLNGALQKKFNKINVNNICNFLKFLEELTSNFAELKEKLNSSPESKKLFFETDLDQLFNISYLFFINYFKNDTVDCLRIAQNKFEVIFGTNKNIKSLISLISNDPQKIHELTQLFEHVHDALQFFSKKNVLDDFHPKNNPKIQMMVSKLLEVEGKDQIKNLINTINYLKQICINYLDKNKLLFFDFFKINSIYIALNLPPNVDIDVVLEKFRNFFSEELDQTTSLIINKFLTTNPTIATELKKYFIVENLQSKLQKSKPDLQFDITSIITQADVEILLSKPNRIHCIPVNEQKIKKLIDQLHKGEIKPSDCQSELQDYFKNLIAEMILTDADTSNFIPIDKIKFKQYFRDHLNQFLKSSTEIMRFAAYNLQKTFKQYEAILVKFLNDPDNQEIKQMAEKLKKQEEVFLSLQAFQPSSEALQGFAPWQRPLAKLVEEFSTSNNFLKLASLKQSQLYVFFVIGLGMKSFNHINKKLNNQLDAIESFDNELSGIESQSIKINYLKNQKELLLSNREKLLPTLYNLYRKYEKELSCLISRFTDHDLDKIYDSQHVFFNDPFQINNDAFINAVSNILDGRNYFNEICQAFLDLPDLKAVLATLPQDFVEPIKNKIPQLLLIDEFDVFHSELGGALPKDSLKVMYDFCRQLNHIYFKVQAFFQTMDSVCKSQNILLNTDIIIPVLSSLLVNNFDSETRISLSDAVECCIHCIANQNLSMFEYYLQNLNASIYAAKIERCQEPNSNANDISEQKSDIEASIVLKCYSSQSFVKVYEKINLADTYDQLATIALYKIRSELSELNDPTLEISIKKLFVVLSEKQNDGKSSTDRLNAFEKEYKRMNSVLKKNKSIHSLLRQIDFLLGHRSNFSQSQPQIVSVQSLFKATHQNQNANDNSMRPNVGKNP